jgi:hypothetical protein
MDPTTASLDATEAECAAKAVAPRVSKEMIEGDIVAVRYATAGEAFHPPTAGEVSSVVGQSLACMTLCAIVMRNGFVVTGESACASPENFNAVLGRSLAYENAFRKIWPLMGYELRSKLAA